MVVSRIEFQNVRSFYGLNTLEFSPHINVLIGKNNSGKSTILSILWQLQQDSPRLITSVGESISYWDIKVLVQEDIDRVFKNYFSTINPDAHYHFRMGNTFDSELVQFVGDKSVKRSFSGFPNREPHHVLIPFGSKRKVGLYDEQINLDNATSITGTLKNLYSKIDRLCAPDYPGGDMFIHICEDLFGYKISPTVSQSGKVAGLLVDTDNSIPLTSMGEGVANLLGFLVELCTAKNKIFIIEEIENDIHPQALKKILDLIIESSKVNQFFLSTHSNVVLKKIGLLKSTSIFQTKMVFDSKTRRPHSSVSLIEDTSMSRQAVLEDLGYEFGDFGLWNCWIFFEESSIEYIVNRVLIPKHVPSLVGKLRTFSCAGVGNVQRKFEEFNDLFVFLHLEPTYKNRVWVVVDGGSEEEKIVKTLRDRYCKSGWRNEQFIQLSSHDLEDCYPQPLLDRFFEIRKIEDSKLRFEKKKKLHSDLKSWIDQNEPLATELFEKNCKEILSILKTIEEQVIRN